MIQKWFSRRKLTPAARREIDPDEIFLDSSNLPRFDTHQFEGRIEKPVERKIFLFLILVFILIGFVILGKLTELQVLEGRSFAIRSEGNNLKHTTIFANRGLIFDRRGTLLAGNAINPDDEFSLRRYAAVSGVAHVLGFLKYPSKDASGVYYEEKYLGRGGVESRYDEELSGRNGIKITETDAVGEVQSENLLRPPRDGENLTLAIDARVSEKLYSLMGETARQYGFSGGGAVIADVETGELLALVSFPEFESDVMTQGKDKEHIQKLLNQKNNPFLNRAVSGLYIPGSTVKPYIAMGVLEEGIISPEEKILSTGSISLPNPYDPTKKSVFKDWKAHGWVDLRQALAVSSNVYFFTVGGGFGDQRGLGIEKIHSYLSSFGFGSPTDVDLEGEEGGLVPSKEWKEKTFNGDPWRLGDTYNTSIGQYGFQVTPLQQARAMAAIANGGYLLSLTILKREEKTLPDAPKLPFSDEYFKIIREGLRLAVTDGTAAGLSMPGIAVAAKTGTAELGVSKELVNSWSIGYFPYDNPKYAFAVLMERGSRYNQVGATLVIRELLEWMYVNTPEYVR
ncbi:hypothetical protein EPN83_02375 [Patescibacteria group bacterium]|nr:MAG: hypothetical protein EPN83_02375 [Patescibacteria group bacterium]